jgi:hypothetical protein
LNWAVEMTANPSPRNLRIVEARDVEGLTYREIGQRFGMSVERARQIYRRTVKLQTIRAQNSDIVSNSSLSIRAVNCLISAGFGEAPRHLVRTWVKYRPFDALKVKNLGHKTLAEIREWASGA